MVISRLIGTLGWANQGRSYDGARVRWDNEKHWVDVFAWQINEKETGGVSNGQPSRLVQPRSSELARH